MRITDAALELQSCVALPTYLRSDEPDLATSLDKSSGSFRDPDLDLIGVTDGPPRERSLLGNCTTERSRLPKIDVADWTKNSQTNALND